MDGLLITWRELLVALALASVFYLLETWLFSRRRRRRADTAEAAPNASTEPAPRLTGALAPGQDGLEAVHRRLASVEQALDELRQALARKEAEEREARDQADTQRATPYGQAVQLARQGLSPQELAHRCDITNGEAELIVALNRGEP